MKTVNKTPVEVFCHDTEKMTDSLRLAMEQQYCKYLRTTCNKPRKSEPHIKVGICSLGATVAGGREIHPVIICPYRFREERFFEEIRINYLSHWKNVKWITEVNLGVGGNVDYVAVELDDRGQVTDFLCVEIQAGGTTGSPYPYVVDLKQHGRYTDTYTYGINWANEFTKTMMQQAYKKGKIVQKWNRKIVFTIQDVALTYLRSSSDCSLVTERDQNSPIDFCTFKMNWETNEWHLKLHEICSTSLEGVNKILGGAAEEDYLTEDDFILNIIRKGISDGILERSNYLSLI